MGGMAKIAGEAIWVVVRHVPLPDGKRPYSLEQLTLVELWGDGGVRVTYRPAGGVPREALQQMFSAWTFALREAFPNVSVGLSPDGDGVLLV